MITIMNVGDGAFFFRVGDGLTANCFAATSTGGTDGVRATSGGATRAATSIRGGGGGSARGLFFFFRFIFRELATVTATVTAGRLGQQFSLFATFSAGFAALTVSPVALGGQRRVTGTGTLGAHAGHNHGVDDRRCLFRGCTRKYIILRGQRHLNPRWRRASAV